MARAVRRQFSKAQRRTYLKGAAFVRRKLSRLDPEIRKEIVRVLRTGGEQILATARAAAPVKTGRLRRAITLKLDTRGLQVKVGIITKSARRSAWYAKFIEFGTLGSVAVARRAVAGKTDLSGDQYRSVYYMNVPPRPARPFIRKAAEIHLPRVRAAAKSAVIRALQRTVKGN